MNPLEVKIPPTGNELQEAYRKAYIDRLTQAVISQNTPTVQPKRNANFALERMRRNSNSANIRNIQNYPGVVSGYYSRLAETREIPHQTLVERTVRPNY